MSYLKQVKDIHSQHVDRLMKIPGVHGVAVGYKTTKEKKTKDLCVIVYVEKKLSENELDKTNLITRELGNSGIKTDVIESPLFRINMGETWKKYGLYKTIHGGCEIRAGNSNSFGTLGMLFFDQISKKVLGLTNWHVIYSGSGPWTIGKKIHQPRYNPLIFLFGLKTSVIGESKLGVNSPYVDAAVFTYNNKRKGKLDVLKLGYCHGTADVGLKDEVQKYGAKTELTFGNVFSVNSTFKMKNKKLVKDCIVVDRRGSTEWSKSGDSGSCVFNENMELVGLHFGTNSYDRGLCCKISNIEKALNIKIAPDQTDTGNFNTSEIRPANYPRLKNKKKVTFTNSYLGYLQIAVGLNCLDMKKGANIRIKSYVSDQTKDGFHINLDSWSNTVMYESGCSWLKITQDDCVQCGTFNTMEDNDSKKQPTLITKKVHFMEPFYEDPKVIVWLNSLDINHKYNCRIKADATKIDKDGFTLTIESWADTIIRSAGVTWIAYPRNRKNISSGSYNTMDVRSWKKPKLENSDLIEFEKPFECSNAPIVLACLNWIDIDHNKNLCLKNTVTNISKSGFTWHINGRGSAKIYSAGASYIAYTDPLPKKQECLEYITVNYPSKRPVIVDGQHLGVTNSILHINRGFRKINLGEPINYSPQSRVINVKNTNPVTPMRIEFEPT